MGATWKEIIITFSADRLDIDSKYCLVVLWKSSLRAQPNSMQNPSQTTCSSWYWSWRNWSIVRCVWGPHHGEAAIPQTTTGGPRTSQYDLPIVVPHTLPKVSRGRSNPSGRAPALTLVGYAPCDRAPPEMHPLKMFEILGHPHFKQLHGHKIPMNATNLPDRLNLYIFSLNLSYHSFVSVHDIQQKRLLNKISV